MADLDDMLGDLLAEDGPQKSKKAQQKTSLQKKGTAKAADDDFYSSLAAEADESDVSEADAKKMAGALDDLDDMDAALFSGSKRPGAGNRASKTPPAKSTPAKTTPAKKDAPKSAPATGRPTKKIPDFDEDDPLAGLLSDEDSARTPRKSPKGADEPSTAKKGAEPTRPDTAEQDRSISSQNSRRLEIERPPTRSGNNKEEEENTPAPSTAPARKPRADDIFGDEEDDVLGGMGLDSPRKTKVVKETTKKGGSSIMDDLFGNKAAEKHLEKPKSAGSNREFVLDQKYIKSSTGKEEAEEDYTFGGYMPSAAGSTAGSRPNSRRSVRFEDEDKPRASSAGTGGRQRGGNSALLDSTNDDLGWLESKPAQQDNRPRSADNILDSKPASILKPNATAPEPVDWLGLSRLGSPESPRPSKTMTDTQTTPQGGRVGRSQSQPTPGSQDQSPEPVEKSTPNKTAATPSGTAADDWLGLGSNDKSLDEDWLGSKPEDDWLGLASSKRTTPARRRGSSDKLLEDREEPSPGQDRPSRFGRHRKRTLEPKRGKAPDEDLFSPPATRDLSSSLPWERPKRHPEASSAASAMASTSPATSGTAAKPPSRASPRSLAASPRSMAAQLQQLSKLEQQDSQPSRAPDAQPSRVPDSQPSRGLDVQIAKPVDKSPDIQATQPLHKTLDGPRSPVKDISFSSPKKTSPASASSILDQLESDIPVVAPSASPMPQLLPSPLNLGALQRQEEMLQQQQRNLVSQQQQQQMELQQRLAAQQAELRQQQQQQLAPLQQAQQQMLQSASQQQMLQSASLQHMQQPLSASLPSMLPMGDSTAMLLQNKIQQLEMDKEHLQTMINTIKQQHQEQVKLVEETYKDRIRLTEETNERREARLREENDQLLAQSQSKLKMAQQEHEALLATQHSRLEAWERDKLQEMDRLKEIHRHSMADLRKEHEETLQHLRKVKDTEMETIAHSQIHTRSMQVVMDQVSHSAKELGEIQQKVDQKHSSVLDEREEAIRIKDQQLQAMKERLEQQQRGMEQERAKLHGLINKLEAQLTEQNQTLEQDRWRVQQEETRLQAQQAAVTRERQQMAEQVKRDKEENQRAKDQLLEEQKTILSQLYEERKALAEERMQFNISLKLKAQDQQRQSMTYKKSEAEIEGSLRMIGDERAKLAAEEVELRQQQQQLVSSQAELEKQRHLLATEKAKLEQLALQIKHRSMEIDDMVVQATRMQEEGGAALGTARKLEAEQSQRTAAIQVQMNALRAKERQIAQERLSLAKERKDLQNVKNQQLCVSCRTPVRDTGNVQVVQQQQGLPAQMIPIQQPAIASQQMTPAAAQLMSTLTPYMQGRTQALETIAQSIQVDRSVRLMRIEAEKDKDYLEEESVFLQALKHSPYHQYQPAAPE